MRLACVGVAVVLAGGALAACAGDEGEAGPAGPGGPAGPAGPQGAAGVSASADGGAGGAACWDTNASGACEPASEDVNGDGRCDIVDCIGDAYVHNGDAGPDASAWIQTSAGTTIDGPLTLSGAGRPGNHVVYERTIEHRHSAGWTQSDFGRKVLRFRGGSPAQEYLILDANGGLVIDAPDIGYGVIPKQGPGVRLLWFPYKAAFRAGNAPGFGPGALAFDDANLGFYSWGGGLGPLASGNYSFAFGEAPIASGSNAVAMGIAVTASGTASMALGARATAGHTGAFVWGDMSSGTVASSAANQFTVRAAGGVRFFTNAAMTAGVTLAAGGSSWSVVSDRNAKTDFKDVDGEAVLGKLAGMPVQSWSYKEEAGRPRHVGPMAQDFKAAFDLGADDTTINTLDLDGVNLAAVKALERRTRDLAAKTRELDELRREMADMRRELRRIASDCKR